MKAMKKTMLLTVVMLSCASGSAYGEEPDGLLGQKPKGPVVVTIDVPDFRKAGESVSNYLFGRGLKEEDWGYQMIQPTDELAVPKDFSVVQDVLGANGVGYATFDPNDGNHIFASTVLSRCWYEAYTSVWIRGWIGSLARDIWRIADKSYGSLPWGFSERFFADAGKGHCRLGGYGTVDDKHARAYVDSTVKPFINGCTPAIDDSDEDLVEAVAQQIRDQKWQCGLIRFDGAIGSGQRVLLVYAAAKCLVRAVDRNGKDIDQKNAMYGKALYVIDPRLGACSQTTGKRFVVLALELDGNVVYSLDYDYRTSFVNETCYSDAKLIQKDRMHVVTMTASQLDGLNAVAAARVTE